MGDGDHCSATYHDSRNEDDDVGNIVADVAKSHAMANSKQLNDVMVGIGHEHTCNLASVSMVNETGVALGICNHVEANPLHKVSLQTSLLHEVAGSGRRVVEVVETSNGPNGLTRSLSERDFIQPNISLEVVLDAAQVDGQSKGPENDKAAPTGEDSPSKEVGDSDDELSPNEDDGEVFQPGALVWANKIKAQLNESKRIRLQRGFSGKEKFNNVGVQGKFWHRKGRNGAPFKNGFQRGALVRAAAMATSSSISISNQGCNQKKIRKEAEVTVQLGINLGLALNGNEDEVLDRIIQMENDDIDKVKIQGVGSGA
ncbi:hypothetical protein LOK49_LG12G02447 [Camellia lanceoleosa]|uniref:Uncharacterized protein n=1 Tax=Camellia lanceoleosa TaxID=1840588 RepID=A0ACC0FU59_9ERIC|nr:hypothetical protein LOK49_LG12G02447 [Camellia lanceoleosa]